MPKINICDTCQFFYLSLTLQTIASSNNKKEGETKMLKARDRKTWLEYFQGKSENSYRKKVVQILGEVNSEN